MNCVWVQNVLLPSEELHLKAARGHTEDVLESLRSFHTGFSLTVDRSEAFCVLCVQTVQ